MNIKKKSMYNSSIYIILLNWNQLSDTSECIDSLLKMNYLNYKIVVVDNGSTDDSSLVIPNKYPQVEYIQNKKNVGFALGNNIGIDYALQKNADYLFILNNDTVVEKDILIKLLTEIEKDQNIAMVGPQMFYFSDPKKTWFFGGDVFFPMGRLNIWQSPKQGFFSNNLILDTDFIAGAGMLVRSNVIKKLKAFDPKFFIYWEDVDLCCRIKRAGYKLKVVSSAYLWHKVSSSATQGFFSNLLMGRNHLLFTRKYSNFFVFWFYIFPLNFLLKIKKIIFSKFSENEITQFKGVFSFLLNENISKRINKKN